MTIYSQSPPNRLMRHPLFFPPFIQNNLDPEKFLRAPREVIDHTLTYIEKRYGSVNDYLDSIGFTEEKRAKLKAALTQ